MAGETFHLYEGGHEYPYFYHSHNCGKQNAPRRTERTVELAVVDHWLKLLGENAPPLAEIGAVSPYYWPNRIRNVIDPADRMGTVRKSMFDVDTMGMDVLSISTIEHIGEKRYGLNEPRTPMDAFRRIVERSNRCLITIPYGWVINNPKVVPLQELLTNGGPFMESHKVRVFALRRAADETWFPSTDFVNYGRPPKPWANSVLIAEKGGLL